MPTSRLLTEAADKILQETGDYLLLENAIKLLIHASKGSTNGLIATTPSRDTSNVDFFAAAVAWYAGSPGDPTFSDNKGNIWTGLTTIICGSDKLRIYYTVPTSVGASHTFQADSGATFTAPAVAVLGFSGIKQTSPLDQQNGDGSTTERFKQGGSITPTAMIPLIISAAMVDNPSGQKTVSDSLSIEESVDSDGVNTVGVAIAWRIQWNPLAIDPRWTWYRAGVNGVNNASFFSLPQFNASWALDDDEQAGTGLD